MNTNDSIRNLECCWMVLALFADTDDVHHMSKERVCWKKRPRAREREREMHWAQKATGVTPLFGIMYTSHSNISLVYYIFYYYPELLSIPIEYSWKVPVSLHQSWNRPYLLKNELLKLRRNSYSGMIKFSVSTKLFRKLYPLYSHLGGCITWFFAQLETNREKNWTHST